MKATFEEMGRTHPPETLEILLALALTSESGATGVTCQGVIEGSYGTPLARVGAQQDFDVQSAADWHFRVFVIEAGQPSRWSANPMDHSPTWGAKGSQMNEHSPHIVPSPATDRMRRHRERRAIGLRCIMIQLRETEIDVLVRKALLDRARRDDPNALVEALHAHLDRTLGRTP
jgi:hypothetical protein